MFKKLTLAAAAGAGYVLGAKAGKERYAQIESKFREIAGMPAVQNATATVKETASSAADTAKVKATETADAVSAKAKGSSSSADVVVDLGATTPPPASTRPPVAPPATVPPSTVPPVSSASTSSSGSGGSVTGSTPPVISRP